MAKFPDKKKYDRLGHGHVNDLNAVARKIANMHDLVPDGTWIQRTFKVTANDSAEDATPGVYKAKMRYYSHSDEVWTEEDEDFEWDLDTNGLEIDIAVDDYVVAFWDNQRSMFIPIKGRGYRHFELKSPHSPGATTPAHPQDWNGTVWVTDTDADREFDVTDPLEIYRGRGKDDFSSPHNQGSLGVAERNNQSSKWEIIRLQPNALLITGLTMAAVASVDSTFTIDGVTVMNPSGAIITDTDPAAAITVYNVHTWDADNDARVVAVWNETTDHWEALQITCPI